ncbi:MAG: outer membrane lipid asymmetry maintenance protein MlaD [Methylotenera sp.]|nr:outer membrane lipid asymmetry maintenance protein MlaD [Methylotenera sp.]
MDRTKIDLWVGIFVALGMAALLGLAMKVGNLTSSKIGETFSVTAAFENVGSLKPNAPVKSAGVVVGRVGSIAFDSKNYLAVVTINIDKRYAFPNDVEANIYTAGLLGEQYLGIEGGGADEPVVNLKNGDKIHKTQDAIVLEKMISTFLFSKASETNIGTQGSTAKATTDTKSTELGDAPF